MKIDPAFMYMKLEVPNMCTGQRPASFCTMTCVMHARHTAGAGALSSGTRLCARALGRLTTRTRARRARSHLIAESLGHLARDAVTVHAREQHLALLIEEEDPANHRVRLRESGGPAFLASACTFALAVGMTSWAKRLKIRADLKWEGQGNRPDGRRGR
jgi:hypothetical protein